MEAIRNGLTSPENDLFGQNNAMEICIMHLLHHSQWRMCPCMRANGTRLHTHTDSRHILPWQPMPKHMTQNWKQRKNHNVFHFDIFDVPVCVLCALIIASKFYTFNIGNCTDQQGSLVGVSMSVWVCLLYILYASIASAYFITTNVSP